MNVKDLTKDKEIKKLASFCNIDLSNLKIKSEEEKNRIKIADKFEGETVLQIMNFLSQVIRPKAVSREFVFKCLSYNENFYIQYQNLLSNSRWMREEVYSKTSKQESSEKQKDQTNLCRYVIMPSEYEEDCKESEDEVLAAATGNFIELPKCSKNETDYEILSAVFDDFSEKINIALRKNIKESKEKNEVNKELYVKLYHKKEGKAFSIGPVIPKTFDDDFLLECIVPQDLIIGSSWGLSFNKDITWLY